MPPKKPTKPAPEARLRDWADVAKPHEDIIRGRFELAVFAANIYEVYKGSAKRDYSSPDLFFERTYLTEGLRELVVAVLRRLSGKPGGDAVVDLITSFGGGKTHSLIALFHIAGAGSAAKNWQGVSEVLKQAGVEPPKARVAVISGEDISPVKPLGEKGEPQRHTLWGELAWQLGKEKGYALVKADDEKRVAPTTEDLAKLLAGDRPTLILADELLQYFNRARGEKVLETTLASQTFNFIKALTEAVDRTPNACLVATLPASVTIEMNVEDEEDYKRLAHIIRRKERVRRLAEGDEIYEIVRRRLFESLGSEEDRKRTVRAYLDYYRKHAGGGDSFPTFVNAPDYQRKMERAYPFHPEFLDVLNERWSSIPNFQRTRGVLRMLALLIGDLHKTDHSPLIQLGSATLSNKNFRSEVLGQIDQRQFDAVVESDFAGTGAAAAKIDAEGNETYQREHLAERTATAIFFYSFGGSTGVSVATPPQLRLAVLQPNLEPAFIPDVLSKIQRRLYYLDSSGGQYRFTVQPNLNAIRVEQEAQVEAERVATLVKQEVERQVEKGDHFRVVVFPQEPRAASDHPTLTLVVLKPEQAWNKASKEATTKAVLEIMRGGSTVRTNKNSLVFLVAEENQRIYGEARSLLALEAVDRLYGRTKKLQEPQLRDLQRMQDEARKSFKQAVWNGYRYPLTPEGDEVKEWDLGRPLYREGASLQEEVWKKLTDRERIAKQLGPSQLFTEDFALWPKDAQAISVKMVKEHFEGYTYLPMLPNIGVLRACIADGVRQGVFGFATGEGGQEGFRSIQFQEPMPPDAVEFGDVAWLVRPEMARKLKQQLSPVPQPEPGGGGTDQPQPPQPEPPKPRPGATTYQRVVIEGELDWKKWADFYEGVIKPLVQAGATVKVHVRTDATSDAGIQRNVVELTIKENVEQRGLGVTVLSDARRQSSLDEVSK